MAGLALPDRIVHRSRYRLVRYRGWLLLAVVCLIPIVFWVFARPLGPRFDRPAAVLKSIANLAAFVGTAALAMNFVLGARLHIIERIFGDLSRMYHVHRRIGYGALIVLGCHAVLIASSRAVSSLWAGLRLFTPFGGWKIVLGLVAFAGMLAVVLAPKVVQLPHATFIRLHQTLGLLFLVASVHVFAVPGTKAASQPLKYYMLGLCTLGVAAFLYRSVLGRFLVSRHRYHVGAVVHLGSAVVELDLVPEETPMPFRPGQFGFLSIDAAELPREAHPFSMASSPHECGLRFVVKALGDYTTTLQYLQPGAPARIEGPYGGFSHLAVENRRQTWIAGGIGFTPFLSMARSLDTDEWLVDFYYCMEGREHGYCLDEFFEISDRVPRLRVVPIRKDSLGRITAEDIRGVRKDLLSNDIFICGPPVMIRNLTTQFRALGVPSAQIHFDDFEVFTP